MKKIVIAVIMISVTATFAQKKAVLKYNYKKGDRYIMELSFTQDMGVMGGTSMSMKGDVAVVNRSKESFKMSNKITRLKADMSQGAKTVSYDSNKKDSELDEEAKKLKAQFASALKSTSIMTLDNTGKVTNVKVEPAIPGVNPNSNQSLMIFAIFPEEALEVGSTWTNEQNIQGMKLKLTYTVKKITGNNVITAISGNINVMGISGKITGNATFDRMSGNNDYLKLDASISMQGVTMIFGTVCTLKKK